MSMLMVRLEFIEKFRDMNLICEMTHNSVRLGMLKMTSGILEEIRGGQNIDLRLVDRLVSINQGQSGDFKIDKNGVVIFRDRVYVPDMPELKKNILEEGYRSGLSIIPVLLKCKKT